MDNNNPWHPQNPWNYHRSDGRIPPQQLPNTNGHGHHMNSFTNAASHTVQDAQRLLASYPMASATPTMHSVRHLTSMNTTAAPPSYVQPSYYSSQPHPGYVQHQPPSMYSEYDHQLASLSSSQVPQNHMDYWQTTRDRSVRLLNEQASRSYPYQEPQQPQHWPQSTYQSSPFSQSVFQRTVSSSAYPTPPPPGISTSSSSLAFALGGSVPPQSHLQPPPQAQQPRHQYPAPPAPQLPQPIPPPIYKAEDSPSFFNEFLERKTRDMGAFAQPVSPAKPAVQLPTSRLPPIPTQMGAMSPPRHKTPPPRTKPADLSPDPLALKGSMSPPSVTPRKRKLIVEIQSPSSKRIQGYVPLHSIAQAPSGMVANHLRTPASSIPHTPTSKGTMSSAPTTGSSSTSITSMSPKTFVPMTPTPNRIVNKAFVLVPTSPWLTPSSSRKGRELDDTPDLGGYGSSGDTPLRRQFDLTDSVRSSVKRTGDRDERGPLEKFVSVVEEIFELEDSLPAEVDSEDLPSEYFSCLSPDCTRPLLNTSTIRKLLKYIGQIARPTKRMRQATAGGSSAGLLATPRTKSGRMADVDIQILSRLLKMLDRSLKQGEDLDPFKPTSASMNGGASGTASVRSSPVKKGARKSKKVKDAEDEDSMDVMEDVEESQHIAKWDVASFVPDDFELEKLTRILDFARDSVLAADCCIAILASDRLAKQLYSEELITSCLSTVKNQLTKVLYPFVEGASPDSINSRIYNTALLQHIAKNGPSDTSSGSTISQVHHRKQMSENFQALSAVLPRINALANAESVAMSDSIIIQAVYIAIGPFFVVESGGEEPASKSSKKEKENVVNRTLGKSAMRGLRLDALSLIRSIFSNHEDQRSWIIEEILTSLIKLSDSKQKAGQFRLRDGRSIRTVSALLLQLVQTSAHDVRINARRIGKDRTNRLALKRQESISDTQNPQNQADEAFLDDLDMEEICLYGTGLESATRAAKTIILFLNSRAGKGKATKNSNEAEYRQIFDNLIDDLLVVLYWPEWPAASLLLSIACKFMVGSLDDVKSVNPQTDSNAAKTMALDHLGVIAGRIRSSIIKVQKDAGEGSYKDLKPLDEIVPQLQSKQLAKFMEAHRDVAAHLCKRSSEDQAYDSARELTAAMLGQELASALKRVNLLLDHPENDEDLNLRDTSKLLGFGQKVKTALREVWKDPVTDVFDIGSQEEVTRIDRLSEEIGTIQSLKNSFQPILNVILTALDAPPIFMRTKALRALGQIITSDSSILGASNVRQGIETHLLDSSPAVRDAAVELIGKYMIDSPEVASNYYQKVAERMADTGLAVRKRVIKLLKSFYGVADDNARKIDISTRLVLRMMDEDDGVKDLAIKTLEEIWFPPLPLPSVMKTKSSAPSNANQDKAALLSKVSIIMGTAANFRGRQSPLEDILHKIIVDKDGSEAASLHKRYAEICEALIDGLVDATDLPGFTINNCIRTIHLFTAAYPPILSGTNASTLLPYLKSASSQEEIHTSDYLLKIFRLSIPHMPKTAAKFGQELQTSLQPMILKPTSGGVQILQEAVGCMCVVVQHLTHDFIRLINLLKGCHGRLLEFLRQPASKQLSPNEVKAMLILIFIVSLLGEHCNFDRLRLEHPNFAADVDSICQSSVIEYIYNTLLKTYNKYDNPIVRGRILQCLGFLFRAQPTLMTKDESSGMMDAIFASDEEEGRARLMKIMQDFLISESEKHSAKEKESAKNKNKVVADVNMEELVGNTDGFADSGVASAIVQRYLPHILQAALSRNTQIQNAAIDVLTFTIKQGLAHPLQSFSVIVALETSPLPYLNNRAVAMHSIVSGKHASLLNTRYSITARESFDYQKKIVTDGIVRGFRMSGSPVALLQRWYSLVREKRAARQDFLKSLVKVFSECETLQASQDDVDFSRYMAENFASFEYKTQEEVFTVIKCLTTVLSTTGMQLLDIISPSHLLTHLHVSSSQPTASQPSEEAIPCISAAVPDNQVSQATDTCDPITVARTSVIIAIVMLLKSHLKTLYGLSEDKCSKFVLGKKSAIGDKPTIKRNDKPISWEKLEYATTPIHSTHDSEAQRKRFLEIWNEDGVTAEPEDDLDQFL